MLDIQAINKTFNPGTINANHALKDLSLHLSDGESVAVIGGNGAGKSTLLNAVAGTWGVDSGSIHLGGVDITHLPEYKRAKYIGRVFQDPMMGTAANMQIEENLALAARRGERRSLRLGITRAERERFREMLKILDLGLENRLTDKAGLLSGGQRQALTLLMATLRKPRLLLLDEHIYEAHSIEEAKELQERNGGYIKTMWCGDLECELAMKEKAGMSSRCIPFAQEKLGETCACCGKPADKMIYWGVAY